MEDQEPIIVESRTVGCDGGGGPLGHPKVYLNIGPSNEVTCPYCSRHYKLPENFKETAGH